MENVLKTERPNTISKRLLGTEKTVLKSDRDRIKAGNLLKLTQEIFMTNLKKTKKNQNFQFIKNFDRRKV